MLTPRNANQFTIASCMTATHEAQRIDSIDSIVRDEVLQLGSEGQLVGILSHPPDGAAGAAGERTDAPAIIILNAGVLHRVGPHRLHVGLARQIAARGNPSLRLDLGGIGDSIASSDATTFRDSAVADTRTAMTGLGAAQGLRRFVLFGVCAGADNAIATALVDDRVAGIVLVDPHTYPTRRSKLRDLRVRVANRGSLREVVRWGLRVSERRLRLAIARARGVGDPPAEGREPPPVETFRAELAQLVERGVRILAVYSGIHGAGYNETDQLFELFPELRGRMDHVYFPDANHTFTELTAQRELIATVTAWIDRRFASTTR
jgi:hypothetical protein